MRKFDCAADLPDCPVFRFTGAAGEPARLTAWDGRDNFANEFPINIINLVGGAKIAVVQVSTPVGCNGRSSVALSDVFAGMGFRGIIHWARDTATYRSIIREFEERHLERARPPILPLGWKPEILLCPCKG